MKSTAVVILNWNGTKHLRRFLPSVIENTPVAVRIIVADNGSTDDSLEVLRCEFPSVEIICLDRNYGFAEGYNQALAQVDAEYCVLLNSDVETPQCWLEPLVERLDADSRVSAVAPKLLWSEARNQFEYAGAAGGYIDYLGYPFCRGRIMKHTEYDDGQYDDAREVFWASGAAFCCRLQLFKELGGFDSHYFAHMEEIDLCWRMQLAGYRVEVEPRSRVYHYGGGTLATDSPNKVFLNHRNNLAMLYRCSTPLQRCVVAVVRPLLDALAAVSYATKGNFRGAWAVARAYGDFIRWHRRLATERREIRTSAKVQKLPATVYRGSIVLRYLIGKKEFNKLM